MLSFPMILRRKLKNIWKRFSICLNIMIQWQTSLRRILLLAIDYLKERGSYLEKTLFGKKPKGFFKKLLLKVVPKIVWRCCWSIFVLPEEF